MKTVNIRNEMNSDYQTVEALTRRAFWNLYAPGCGEHYLVHIMRSHEDFLPELDLVLELDGTVIGNIMYTKAKLVDDTGFEKQILTFGPISILPEHQRRGYGKLLIDHSFDAAKKLGYDTVVIFGNPGNYVGRGFVSCKKLNICLEDGLFPSAMLGKQLKEGALDGRRWIYHDSPVMRLDEGAMNRFDSGLEPMEKKVLPSQEEFFIHSSSYIK